MIQLHSTVVNNPLLKIQLNVLRYCGFAVFDDQRFHFVHKFRGYLIMFIWSLFVICQLIDLYEAYGDIGKMTTNAAATLLFSIVIGQCYGILYYRSDLMTILINEVATNTLKIHNFDGITEKHKRHIMNIFAKNIRNSKTLALVIWISVFISVQILTFLTIWKYFQVDGLSAEERDDVNLLLIRSWYPIDVYENFIPIFIHQLVNCYLGFIIVPLIHTLIVVFMIYAIAMLQILKYRCETLTDGVNDIYSLDVRDTLLKHRLRDIIVTQLEVTQFVKNLNELINVSMFIIFVLFSVLLCSALFQISTMEFGSGMIIPIFFVVNINVVLLMFYWHANEIALHSSELPNSIYFSNWYACSTKFQNLVLQFMIGSQKPLTLTALYFTMNLDAFINILKASYSYFTLLSCISDRAVNE